MRGVVVLTLVTLVGAACGTAARWERSGASATDLRRDETECSSLASRDRSVPTQRLSRTGTRYNENVELVTVRDFDSGAFDECMKARGYARVAPRPPG